MLFQIRLLFLLLLCSLLIRCDDINKSYSRQKKQIISQLDTNAIFDSAFHQLISNYSWLNKEIESSIKNLPASNHFKIIRHIYNNKFGFNVQLRKLNNCGGCPDFNVIFINGRNNTNHVIPLTDNIYLRKHACKNEETNNKLLFEKELNVFLDKFSINSITDKIEIINFLMKDLLQEMEIELKHKKRINEEAQRFIINDSKGIPSGRSYLSKNCKDSIQINLIQVFKELEKSHQNHYPLNKSFYFSFKKGNMTLYKFQIPNKDERNVNIKYINSNCYCYPEY